MGTVRLLMLLSLEQACGAASTVAACLLRELNDELIQVRAGLRARRSLEDVARELPLVTVDAEHAALEFGSEKYISEAQ